MKPKTVTSKVPYIADILSENKQLFVGLSETWLKDHKDAELNVEGYKLFRGDRSRIKASRRGRESGGVAFYLRNDLAATCEPIFTFSNGVIEILTMYSRVENLILCIMYRQPDDEAHGHPSKCKEFEGAMNKLKDVILKFDGPVPDVVVGGDFNLPCIDWDSKTPNTNCTKDTKDMFNVLTAFMEELCLSQIVMQSTHKMGNILDLVLTNNTDLIHDYQCNVPVESVTDHYFIEVSTSYKLNVQRYKERKKWKREGFDALNFFHSDIDWEEVSHQLNNHNWERDFRGRTVDQILLIFYDVTYDICLKLIPKRSSQNKGKTRSELNRLKLTRRRRRINKLLSFITSPSRKSKLNGELIKIERNLQMMYRQHQIFTEAKAVSNIKINPKFFFNYAKKFSKIKSNIGPLIDDDGSYVTEPKTMAGLLSNQYASVFSTPRDAPQTEETSQDRIDTISFNEDDIIAAIEELKADSSAGPDGFPAILLKNCKLSLSKPLFILWKRSFDEGHIPVPLKKSMISPIHKGGSKALRANYRPVALTSHLIKIFEKVLRRNVAEFMDMHGKFNPNNHGFREGHSCLSQLLAHYDNILDHLEAGYNVDVVYLDFAKAFDKVDFSIVLNKMINLGITGKVHDWIQAFLTDRKQVVTVEGEHSEPVPVISGVPQGSVLGPLIFLILMVDIDSGISNGTSLSSFADDTRALKGVKNIFDCTKLQEDLFTVYEWASDNNMEYNSSKFEAVRYGLDEVLKLCTNYVSDRGTIIDQKDHIRDLGITMSSDCSFKNHIENVVENTTKLSAWILRTFRSREPDVMLTLWKTLVLPKFDYCSQLWCPLKTGDIQKLEVVQKSFLRKIKGSWNRNYWECLSKYKLYSLQRRRERYRIIYVWKILETVVPNIGSIGLQPHFTLRNGRYCSVQSMKRGVPAFLQSIRSATLGVHGAQLFNCMPQTVRDKSNCSVDDFKHELDKVLLKIPDEPQIRGYTALRRRETNSVIDMIGIMKDQRAEVLFT